VGHVPTAPFARRAIPIAPLTTTFERAHRFLFLLEPSLDEMSMSNKPARTTRTSRKTGTAQHRRRRDGVRTVETEERFLRALRLGKSIAGCANAAGVGRRTVYDWRKADSRFAERWDEAWDVGTDYLEDLALKNAERGSERLLLALLKARRPERYSRTLIDHGGEIEVVLRNAADSLTRKLARFSQP
jgi:hypothetical protein